MKENKYDMEALQKYTHDKGRGDVEKMASKSYLPVPEVFEGGFEEIVNMMMKGFNNKLDKHDADFGMISASKGGHIHLVKMAISYGGNSFQKAMENALEYGHRDIAELMISYGANNWNNGLKSACKFGNIDNVKLIISSGASDLDRGLVVACEYGHLELVKFLVSERGERGILSIIEGILLSAKNGHNDIVEFLISREQKISQDNTVQIFNKANVKLIEILLKRGLDIPIIDWEKLVKKSTPETIKFIIFKKKKWFDFNKEKYRGFMRLLSLKQMKICLNEFDVPSSMIKTMIKKMYQIKFIKRMK